jgi:hypothetical protein
MPQFSLKWLHPVPMPVTEHQLPHKVQVYPPSPLTHSQVVEMTAFLYLSFSQASVALPCLQQLAKPASQFPLFTFCLAVLPFFWCYLQTIRAHFPGHLGWVGCFLPRISPVQCPHFLPLGCTQPPLPMIPLKAEKGASPSTSVL